MSNPFKAVGKIFKGVVKVVKKVALPALMIGAVVLTGGAALGVLPAIGSVLGSIGISGTLASVLGGAISMGAVGAVTGGLVSGLSGGNVLKGATTGFLGGAITGGVLGGVGAIGANGILGGAAKAATTAGGNFAATATNALDPVTASIGGAGNALGLAPTVGPAAASAAGGVGAAALPAAGVTGAAAPAAAAAGGGGLLNNPYLMMLGGNLLSGIGQGSAAKAQIDAEQQSLRDKYDRIAFNYGYKNIYGDKKSDVPTDMTQWYDYTAPALQQPDFLTAYSGQNSGLLGSAAYQSGLVPTTYDIINGRIVARQPPVGGA